MSEPTTDGPRDGGDGDGDGDAVGAAAANVDEEEDRNDGYDLYDRNNLYAKAEGSYKHEWSKPDGHKLSLHQIDVDTIRDFDSNDDSHDDHHYSSDNHKDHPPPDRCCIPANLDLSAMLVKERRTKKILLLLCFLLGVTCISLLFDTQSRTSRSTMGSMSTSNTEYMRTDSGYELEEENNDVFEDIAAAQGYGEEIGGGEYSNTIPVDLEKTETDSLQDTMEQQQQEQPLPPEVYDTQDYEADSILNPQNNDLAQDGDGNYPLEPSDDDKGWGNIQNNDPMEQQQQQESHYPPEDINEAVYLIPAQDVSGEEPLRMDYSQDLFGNIGNGSITENVLSPSDNNDPNIDLSQLDGAEPGAMNDEGAPINSLPMATRFRSLDTYNTGEQPNGDLPFFWYIPKASSNIVEDIVMQCYSLVGVTGKSGLDINEDNTEPLAAFDGEDGRKYVNINISSPGGVQSAIGRNFVQSNLADVVISPLIRDVSKLFDDSRNELEEQQQQQLGRCFTVLRNPIDRAVSIYHHLRSTSEEWKNTTIDKYVKSIYCENNWMVRELTGKLDGGIPTMDDLEQAKNFIRDYCVIGLAEQLMVSVRRFQEVFGWRKQAMECVDHTMRSGVVDMPGYEKFDEGSYMWNLIKENNEFDLELYHYAVQLFNQRETDMNL